MAAPGDLDRLAHLAGIEPFYWDIFGTRHETSEAARRAILAAMGFDVGSAPALAESLREYETRPWRRLVEPVTALRLGRGGEPPAVTVALPADGRPERLRWSLAREDGERIEGEERTDALAPVEDREVDGRRVVRLRLPLARDGIVPGYHRLTVEAGKAGASAALIAAPARAFLPEFIVRGERRWGVACHLYQLRSAGDWGVGDFADLGALAETVAGRGADFVGLNPLHALFPGKPEHASPYSPSSRLFLNPLYVDMAGVPEFAADPEARRLAGSAEFERSLAAARASPHVDYTAAARRKRAVLERLFAAFETGAPPARRNAFEVFLGAGGEPLRRFALFEALSERHLERPWHQWPEPLRRPDSPAAAAFADAERPRLRFHLYLQWLADTQLAEAAARARAAGMAVGLYRDLAVGASPDGFDTWADGGSLALGARFGAPPDAFNPSGQDWGLPPLNPVALRERAFAPFARVLAANMRHAGALRIDHVMALVRLYWIPPGAKAAEGAYLRYPLDDLLAVVALESHRNRCLVIGEDLGTVPEGFRERMAEEGLLSYRLFIFEREPDGRFKRAGAYPARAVAAATTHDLPTVAGYWRGADIAVKRRLGRREEGAEADRARERDRLVAVLAEAGLIGADFPRAPEIPEEAMTRLVLALHRFLAASPAALLLVNLDDLLVEEAQLNVPGTVEEYPNWRRRLAVAIERLGGDPRLAATAAALAAAGRGPATSGSG
ncbi:MAG: 4-alpha-glucanotransferase [Proteobacteria bacterium]|nr:4-alpha-glucanotransferase [Pseudomonadota bacterium]